MPSNARLRGNLTRELGREIRRARIQRRLTQQEVSKNAGLPRNTYSAIERGSCAIDVEQLASIALSMGEWPSETLLRASARAWSGSLTLPKPRLTEREAEVLEVWLYLDTVEEAAATLNIATSTLNTHLKRVRQKYLQVGRESSTKINMLVNALYDGIVTLDTMLPPFDSVGPRRTSFE